MAVMDEPAADAEMQRTTGGRFEDLVGLIARLRGPGGCPWDREQTHASLKPMAIEEAYEVAEAIDEGGDAELAGELGDLLLQVVFHAQIAFEQGRFSIDDVVDHVSGKMRRRHPHVFGDHKADTPAEVLRTWEALKEAELAESGTDRGAATSMLDSVSRSLPAILEAYQASTKASRIGFDWPDAEAVLAKVDEELRELRQATAENPAGHPDIESEMGDLLFAAVNAARLLRVDPESALKAANRKFRRRFRYVEDRLRERGKKPADSRLEEMEELWSDAKALERQGPKQDPRT